MAVQDLADIIFGQNTFVTLAAPTLVIGIARESDVKQVRSLIPG
jgi:hypothetical protein